MKTCIGKNTAGWFCSTGGHSNFLSKNKCFEKFTSDRSDDFYFDLKDIFKILGELGIEPVCGYNEDKSEYNEVERKYLMETERKVFKKSDLKNGDIVVNLYNEVYIVLDDYIRGPDGFDKLENYNNDLTSGSSFRNLDVMKVYRPGNTLKGLVLKPFNPGDAKLIYEREDKPEPNITIDGYKVSFNDDGIKVGCKAISKEEIKAIYEGSLKKSEPAPKLQGGDVILTKDGTAYQLCGDKFLGHNGYNYTSLYNMDLSCKSNHEGFEITEVYRAYNRFGDFKLHPFNSGSMTKIWSGNHTVELANDTVLFFDSHISVCGRKVAKDVVKQIYEVCWGKSE